MDEERLTLLRRLEDCLGYEFKEIERLDASLTHKSYAHESAPLHPDPSKANGNEVLEFLGDAVLNLTISHLLLERFPEAQEGVLSKKRSHLVKRSFLAHLSRELQLEQYVLLGKGELLDGGKKKSSILANAYEALIGAIYLDSGFHRCLEIVRGHFGPYFDSQKNLQLFSDYKSQFQEHSQEVYRLSPRYQVIVESGPDHDKRFQATVLIGKEIKGCGWGRSKKEAEQEAARQALKVLKAPDDPVQISDLDSNGL